jgi:recombinational DNA repair protein RecT
LCPFKGKAQLVIGYKGMNTLAARSGFTVQGEVVREGDAFDYELGDKGFVRHKPKLGNQGKIIAAWATASSMERPSIISVLGIDDIMAIKAKSPGASRSDSPWNDPKIGFPAMASKSAKRRLARAMPLNADPRFHLAAAMEEAVEERGRTHGSTRSAACRSRARHARRPDDQHEQRGTMAKTDAQQEAEINREMDKYDRWYNSLTVQQQIRVERGAALRRIMENRVRLRNPKLCTVEYIVGMWKDGVRRNQRRLVKIRAWRSTGIYPGEA